MIAPGIIPEYRKGNYMQTVSGVLYWPLDPRVEDVRIGDIAHSLAMQCRYCGHCRAFYSVAEHSVHVSYLVPRELALLGLLHDATEAYLSDVIRPLKRHLTNYKELERLNWRVIAAKFGLPEEMPEEIHRADAAMLNRERIELMPPIPPEMLDGWLLGDVQPPAAVGLYCYPPHLARSQFMNRYYILTGMRD